MASYTITTNRQQEIGLDFAYEDADKTLFPTQESYFQYLINQGVSDPLYSEYLRAQSVALDKSIATIPEANMPAAKTEIEQIIINNGGTLVPAGQFNPLPPLP